MSRLLLMNVFAALASKSVAIANIIVSDVAGRALAVVQVSKPRARDVNGGRKFQDRRSVCVAGAAR